MTIQISEKMGDHLPPLAFFSSNLAYSSTEISSTFPRTRYCLKKCISGMSNLRCNCLLGGNENRRSVNLVMKNVRSEGMPHRTLWITE